MPPIAVGVGSCSSSRSLIAVPSFMLSYALTPLLPRSNERSAKPCFAAAPSSATARSGEANSGEAMSGVTNSRLAAERQSAAVAKQQVGD